ncbi:MAG: CrcB family protein [Actinomycetota bacterium]
MIWVLVAFGGAFGALSRWLATVILPDHRSGFPLPITLVNILGAFALGVAVGLDRAGALPVNLLPLTTGALGGYTTFSTWMVDVDTAGSGLLRAGIAVVPAVAGIAAAALGLLLGSSVV